MIRSGNSLSGYGLPWASPRGIQLELEMQTVKKLMSRVMNDENSGEILEYALIAGLIIVAAIAVFGTVGVKILGHWTGGAGAL